VPFCAPWPPPVAVLLVYARQSRWRRCSRRDAATAPLEEPPFAWNSPVRSERFVVTYTEPPAPPLELVPPFPMVPLR